MTSSHHHKESTIQGPSYHNSVTQSANLYPSPQLATETIRFQFLLTYRAAPICSSVATSITRHCSANMFISCYIHHTPLQRQYVHQLLHPSHATAAPVCSSVATSITRHCSSNMFISCYIHHTPLQRQYVHQLLHPLHATAAPICSSVATSIKRHCSANMMILPCLVKGFQVHQNRFRRQAGHCIIRPP